MKPRRTQGRPARSFRLKTTSPNGKNFPPGVDEGRGYIVYTDVIHLRRKLTNLLLTLGLAIFATGCMFVEPFGLKPPSDVVSIPQLIPGVFRGATNGWFYGCNDFLAENPDITETNCADQQGAEFFALYFNHAISAIQNLAPTLRSRGHFSYRADSVARCLERVQWNSYWLTRLYLQSTYNTGETGAGDDHLAESTYVGAQGTRACADELEGSGRLIEAGGIGI